MLLTVEQLKHASVMHPEVAELLKANPRPVVDESDYRVLRDAAAVAEQMGANALGPPGPDIDVSFIEIEMRDGYKSQLKVHRPTSPPAKGCPLIVLCFGGGWIYGSNRQLDFVARMLLRLFGAVVVSISYRLAPEHPFPVPNQDGFDSVKWIASNAAQLKADPSLGFIVGGVSAGGTMSAIIARQAQVERLAHPITGTWLCVPTVLAESLVPEKFKHLYLAPDDNKETCILASMALNTMRTCGKWRTDDPWRYPTASNHPLTGLPPAYIQADGMDPLRDDALIYDEMLKESGVRTKIDHYPGCPHAHFALLPGITVSTNATVDILKGFAWLLDHEVTKNDILQAFK